MLAVLAFENPSGNPDQEYFSDGLTEEVITQLGGLQPEQLGVIARTSVERYKHGAKPVDQIGRELGVQYVLEGSLRRSGDQVRVTAQLIQVKDQTHLWAKTYDDQKLRDILVLQSDLAQEVARQVNLELSPAYRSKVSRARAVAPEVHEAYLHGQYFLSKRTAKDLARAVDSFQQALQKDSNYAPAYAGLPTPYVLQGSEQALPGETMEKARVAAIKAIDLDSSLAEPRAGLALIVQNYAWDWPEAERQYKRAIALNPSYSTARMWYSLGLLCRGQFDQANAELQRAHQWDPLSIVIDMNLGFFLWGERQPGKAVERLNKTLDLEPNFAAAYLTRGLAYAQLGKLKETTAAFETGIRLDTTPPTLPLYGTSLPLLV